MDALKRIDPHKDSEHMEIIVRQVTAIRPNVHEQYHPFDAKNARVKVECLQLSPKGISCPQTHIKMLRTDVRHKEDASCSGVRPALAGYWRFQIHRTQSPSDQTGILIEHVHVCSSAGASRPRLLQHLS